MKKTITEILQDYTGGKSGLEETNQALREAESGFSLKPGKNALTEEEIRATTIGYYPDMANGFGLLDTGTGTLDKVRVERGSLKPGKNALTEEEIRATTIGYYPDMANGFGLLDTGTGTLDKVRVERGRLTDCDCGNMPALVTLAGRTYEVRGRVLADRSAG